jgi:hypothetical protein
MSKGSGQTQLSSISLSLKNNKCSQETTIGFLPVMKQKMKFWITYPFTTVSGSIPHRVIYRQWNMRKNSFFALTITFGWYIIPV